MEAEVKEIMMEKVRRFQCSDKELPQLMDYLENKCLPEEQSNDKRVLAQATKAKAFGKYRSYLNRLLL